MKGRGLPTTMTVLATIGGAFVLVPLVALTLRVPWDRLGEVLSTPTVRTAILVSVAASIGSLGVAAVLGFPIAWVLGRLSFRGKRLFRALVTLPMVIPPVVAGVGLLGVFGRRGLLGEPLGTAFGVTIPFSLLAVVLAGAFVSMPFLVITIEAGIASLDTRYEEAAATLGAGRWYVLRRVTLPLIAPSVAAGLALSWARALGEFGATITFAGNIPGRTQTMPLAVFIELERDPGAAYLLSFVLVVISLLVLLALRRRPRPV